MGGTSRSCATSAAARPTSASSAWASSRACRHSSASRSAITCCSAATTWISRSQRSSKSASRRPVQGSGSRSHSARACAASAVRRKSGCSATILHPRCRSPFSAPADLSSASPLPLISARMRSRAPSRTFYRSPRVARSGPLAIDARGSGSSVCPTRQTSRLPAISRRSSPDPRRRSASITGPSSSSMAG